MNDLEQIKKAYGERFMKLCRNLFPTILEDEGKLYNILSSEFSKNSKTLYEDIVKNSLEEKFKKHIYSKIDNEKEEKPIIEDKTPYELLDEAGYNLYECKTEQEIQSFKKYYAPSEELCTFYDRRLERCHVFFAVKKDVENIKRENFKEPKREDEYGTSVMGIQFAKDGMCTVSIKNRYNHKVNNPDATYENNLNRIIYGLEQSFNELLKQRGLEFSKSNIEKMSIPGYTVANNGMYYKYNMEVNGIYYCPGNIVIKDGHPNVLDKNEQLIDCYIADTKNKTVKTFDGSVVDSFEDDLQDIAKIEIKRDKEKDVKNIIVYKEGQKEPISIKFNESNEIVGYTNKSLQKVEYGFMKNNKKLNKLELPNLEQAGDDFLYSNKDIMELNLPKLQQVGNDFLGTNKKIVQLELPNLEKVGNDFLYANRGLTQLKLLKLQDLGDNCIFCNKSIKQLEMPKLKSMGENCLRDNEGLTELSLPQLKCLKDYCFSSNKTISKVELPNLEIAGYDFLYSNKGLTQLSLPKLKQVKFGFVHDNKVLDEVELPNLENANELKMIKKLFTPNNIAKIDKDNEIAQSEINQAGKDIAKVIVKENYKSER